MSSPNEKTQLTDLLSKATLKTFQDGVASITKLPTAICDTKGQPLIAVSCAGCVLDMMQSTKTGQRLLNEIVVDPSAGRVPLIFATAPIKLRQRRLGAVVSGGLPPTPWGEQQIRSFGQHVGLTTDQIEELTRTLEHFPAVDVADTQRLVGTMADILGKLAEHAFDVQHREDQLGSVQDIAALLSGTQDLHDVLNRIARQVVEVMEVKACSIRLLNEQTNELVIEAVHNLSQAYLDKGAVLLGANPIDTAAFGGQAVYVEDAASDPRTRFPEQARKEGIVSGLNVGMRYRGQTIGVMRVYTGQRHHFSAAETAMLSSIASQAAAAIIHSRLYLDAAAAHNYQHQLRYAGDIQRRMIPDHVPEHRKVDLAFVYEPSFEVGGDFFDFLDFAESGELGICIADLVGKGIPAALMMASLRTAFRLYALATMEITEAMTMTNIHMCKQSLVGEFATLHYCIFSENGRRLTYCNAGHDPPILLRGDKARYLEEGGMILGVCDSESYSKKAIALKKDDALVFYTDGLVNAENFSGEVFGRERLLESIRRYAPQPASILAQSLIWDVRRFVGLADQADDLTLVVAKVT